MTDPFATSSALATEPLDGDDLVVNGRYRLPPPPGEVGAKSSGVCWYSRASSFGKAIVDDYNLQLWKERMLGWGLVMRPDMLAAIANLGAPNDKNKKKHNELCDDARKAAGSDVGSNLGTALHGFAEMLDLGQEPQVPPTWRPHLAAYVKLMQDHGLVVIEIEQVIVNLKYGIAGRFDRFVRTTRELTFFVDGETVTIPAGTILCLDLKTGKNPSYGAMEIAVQLHAYSSADWIFDVETREYRPMPDNVNQDYALVVHLPAQGEAGGTAHLMMVNIGKGRQLAELCAAVKSARNMKGLMTEVYVAEGETDAITQAFIDTAVESTGAPMRIVSERVTTAPAVVTLADRARSATEKSELERVWFDAIKSRQDTPALGTVIATRLKEIAS